MRRSIDEEFFAMSCGEFVFCSALCNGRESPPNSSVRGIFKYCPSNQAFDSVDMLSTVPHALITLVIYEIHP